MKNISLDEFPTLTAPPADLEAGYWVLYYLSTDGKLYLKLGSNPPEEVGAGSVEETLQAEIENPATVEANKYVSARRFWQGLISANLQGKALAENSLWIGGATNEAEETTTAGVLSGQATLAAGTASIANANILATSIIIITPKTAGTLTGNLRASTALGSITVESRDSSNTIIATDTAVFNYLIII